MIKILRNSAHIRSIVVLSHFTYIKGIDQHFDFDCVYLLFRQCQAVESGIMLLLLLLKTTIIIWNSSNDFWKQ